MVDDFKSSTIIEFNDISEVVITPIIPEFLFERMNLHQKRFLFLINNILLIIIDKFTQLCGVKIYYIKFYKVITK